MVEPMATQAGGIKGSFPALLVAGIGDAVIEFIQDGFTRQARNPGPLRLDPVSGALGDILFRSLINQGHQEGGGRQFPLAVDADIEDILGIELKIQPRAAIGNNPGREKQLARGMGLAAVMIKEHAR